MKKLFILSFLVAMCLSMSAQITSSQTSITHRTVIEEPHATGYFGWNSLYVEYLPFKISSVSYNGAALNYSHAFSLTQKIPLYLETGLGGQYSFKKQDGITTHFASVKIPLNVLYEYDIPGTSISVDPFVGARLRVNVWGETKYNNDLFDGYGDNRSIDLFSDEVGCKRVQVGWHAGLKIHFNKVAFIGAAYGMDFMDFSKGSKIKEVAVSLGVDF